MLCKNCGRELPIAGKFCPFCGAVVEQEGVNDETAVFTSLPEELKGPIDLSAFDEVMKEDHPGGSFSGDGVTTGDPLAVTDPRGSAADAPHFRYTACSGHIACSGCIPFVGYAAHDLFFRS